MELKQTRAQRRDYVDDEAAAADDDDDDCDKHWQTKTQSRENRSGPKVEITKTSPKRVRNRKTHHAPK